MEDQDGMRAIGAAVAALGLDPYHPEGFLRGEYHRLRVGQPNRVMTVDDQLADSASNAPSP